jgi:hypothetical protein
MNNATLHFSDLIIKLSKEGKMLTDTEIGHYIAEFDRRYAFPLKNRVIEDFKTEKVKVLYNDKNYILPSTIPGYLINAGTNIICCVNVSNDMRVNKNNEYIIDPKVLYSLMQMGSIIGLCFSKYSFMKNKVNIIKIGSRMYSKLFSKVMNRLFTLSITPAKQDAITYLASMFFITNMLGRDDESLEDMNKKYALDNCNKINNLVIDDYARQFDNRDYTDLNTFIEAIKKNIPGMETLSVRGFVDNYISQFGPSMLFATEYLPFFIGNIGYVLVGAMLNNQTVIENNLGMKDIMDLFSELSSL